MRVEGTQPRKVVPIEMARTRRVVPIEMARKLALKDKRTN